MTEEQIKNDIIELAPPPDKNLKLNMINSEVNEFSRLTNWLTDLVSYSKPENEDPLPFYINTKKHRMLRKEIRIKAAKEIDHRWNCMKK